jgi:hypothetical protein
LAAIFYGEHSDHTTLNPFETDTPISDAKPMRSGELTFQRLNVAIASFSITSQCEKNSHCGFPVRPS